MPSLPFTRPSGRVLIVGDDVTVTEAFSRALRLSGSEVWACSSAADGLALARTHLPQVLVVDLRSTLAVSLGLAKAVRDAAGSDAPLDVIITTGEDAQAPEPAELEALHVELCYRPVWLSELVALARDRLAVPAAG